jgi:hypothetical protein
VSKLDGIKPGDLLIEAAHGIGDVHIHKVSRLTKIYAITGSQQDQKWRLSDGIQPGEVSGFQIRRRVRKPEPGELDAIKLRRRFYGLMRHLEEATKEARKDIAKPTAENIAAAEKALALVQSLLEPATEVHA